MQIYALLVVAAAAVASATSANGPITDDMLVAREENKGKGGGTKGKPNGGDNSLSSNCQQCNDCTQGCGRLGFELHGGDGGDGQVDMLACQAGCALRDYCKNCK